MPPPPLYVPEFRVRIDGQPVPAVLRASITSVSLQSGLEGADRVEITLANEGLRWLDHPLLALDRQLSLSLGYLPDAVEQLFVGEVVGQAAAFPAGGTPTLTVAAQDRRQRLQEAHHTRWFAVPVSDVGNYPLPDLGVAAAVSAEHDLVPLFDPIGASLAVLLGGVDVAVGMGDPTEMQKVIRRQLGETDYAFLQRIAAQNGWEMRVDHADPLGGSKLVFLSPLAHLLPDVTLRYGESLVDFTPRVSRVGQIAGVSVVVWRPDVKMEFTVTAAWDWDRQALVLTITPGFGLPGGASGAPAAASAAPGGGSAAPGAAGPAAGSAGGGSAGGGSTGGGGAASTRTAQLQASQSPLAASPSGTLLMVDEPVSLAAAPRVIVSSLLPRLNSRLTGHGSAVGNPRIRAGSVLRLEGLGQQFGGLYRVTSASHSLGGDGYRTSFEVRKEVWFGSIPLPEQGAIPVRPLGRRIAS